MDTETRKCCRCGSSFQPARAWSNFCSDKCRVGFHAANKSEGGPLAPLVKAWIATRHAKPGTPEAEVCNFARREITAMASAFNESDAEEGHVGAVEWVKTLMASGTLYMDRARR